MVISDRMELIWLSEKWRNYEKNFEILESENLWIDQRLLVLRTIWLSGFIITLIVFSHFWNMWLAGNRLVRSACNDYRWFTSQSVVGRNSWKFMIENFMENLVTKITISNCSFANILTRFIRDFDCRLSIQSNTNLLHTWTFDDLMISDLNDVQLMLDISAHKKDELE